MPKVIAVSSTPAPAANVRLPSQSMRALRVLAISLSDLYAQTVPNRPNGRLTQKTARQSQAASRPPSSRPTNWPEMPATWLMPSAMPRWPSGNASVRIAAELAISIAPPNAWTKRQPMSHSAPCVPWNGSKERPTEARVKTTKPRL